MNPAAKLVVLGEAQQAWRGNANHTRLPYTLFGGSSWSGLFRARHRSAVAWRQIQIAIPTFYIPALTDTDLPNDCNFSAALEYPFIDAWTGLPARLSFRFSGATTAAYTAAGGPYGYILSDVLDVGQMVPANTPFGIWTCVENAAGTGTNTLPAGVSIGSSSVAYEGWDFATSSQLTSPATATSITSRSSSGSAFGPAIILVKGNAKAKCIAILGDSLSFGTGEAELTGDSNQNSGWPSRFAGTTLGYGYFNLSRAGDKIFSNSTLANVKYRMQLLALGNPTHIHYQPGTNDFSSAETSAQVTTFLATVNGYLRTNAPNARIIGSTVLPRVTTTDAYATTANQTNVAGFSGGVGTSEASKWNAKVRAGTAGYDGYIDPNTVADNSPDSFIWKVTGAANYATADGVHSTAAMNALIAAGVSNPFN